MTFPRFGCADVESMRFSVHEIERANRRAPDREQLDYAAASGRVQVTYNRNDDQVPRKVSASRHFRQSPLIRPTQRL
jgi:hypothetical protein